MAPFFFPLFFWPFYLASYCCFKMTFSISLHNFFFWVFLSSYFNWAFDVNRFNYWYISCSNMQWKFCFRSPVLLPHTTSVGPQAPWQLFWHALAWQFSQWISLLVVTLATCLKIGNYFKGIMGKMFCWFKTFLPLNYCVIFYLELLSRISF